MTIYKSPDAPEFLPAFLHILILVPSSTPAGILTERLFLVNNPSPPHFLQGFVIVLPVPEQLLQVLSIVKNLTCSYFSTSIQTVHTDMLASPPEEPLPLQISHLEELSVLLFSLFLSSSDKLTDKLYLRSDPC